MKQSFESIRKLNRSVQLDNLAPAERDIENALKNKQSNFVLKTDDFYYSNGRSKRLLNLSGVIITNYRGSAYNIPVELWIQEDHPNSAPICYVKPTVNMHVASNNDNVESDGRISVPYLRNWTLPTSSLTTLIDELSEAFGVKSPVYSTLQPNQRSSIPIQASQNPFSTVNQSNNLNSATTNHDRCRICSKNDIDCVLLDCGHLISCSACASCFKMCPICRSPISQIKTILRT